MRWALLLGILAVLALPASSRAGGCTAVSGSFDVIRSSAGAGNIVYTLRLRNAGPQSCLLRGLPQLRLLGKGGVPLPTKIVPDPRYTPKPFLLRPGRTATAKARFSPDVPGPGEPVAGRNCEPVAYTARVSVGATSIVVRLNGHTSVCEHGLLTFTPYR